MFVQVLQGSTSDGGSLQARFEGWAQEHRAAAPGWLGATGGVTGDNVFVAVVRFEDEESARRNSERPEQGEWWAATEPLFDGPVTFHDYQHSDLMLRGGSDAAGFVQIIQGTYTGDGSPAMPDQDAQAVSALRPDVIGGTTAWDDAGHFTQVVYFTSEDGARAGEAAMGDDPDAVARMERFLAEVTGIQYFDLRDPWFA